MMEVTLKGGDVAVTPPSFPATCNSHKSGLTMRGGALCGGGVGKYRRLPWGDMSLLVKGEGGLWREAGRYLERQVRGYGNVVVATRSLTDGVEKNTGTRLLWVQEDYYWERWQTEHGNSWRRDWVGWA